MKIKFLGTGAAEGVPAMFCNCSFCRNIRAGAGEKRTRSQVLIDGILSVDFPPDTFGNCLKHGVELAKIRYVLATHSHMDHFYAHDFILRGYKYASLTEPKLDIYGDEEVIKVFNECTSREMREDVAAGISVRQINPETVFYAGDYRVIAVAAKHSVTEKCLLFYIERDGKSYLHFYDTGKVEESAFKFLKNNGAKANVVAFDCTFADADNVSSPRHMNICDNMIMKKMLSDYGIIEEDSKIIVTHFSHNCNPTYARLAAIEKEFGVKAAYDGLEIIV